MTAGDKLHLIQRDILNILLYSKQSRFSDLNIHELSNDHFTFHIKKLVLNNLIFKNTDGLYELTVEGKAFVTSMNFRKNTKEGRQKVLGFVVVTKDFDGVAKYLIHKRKRQPYFDYYGFTTTRVPRGFTFETFTKEKFKERSGLECELELIGIEHKMDYSEENELLEDNIFVVYKAVSFSGELIEQAIDGENTWMTKDELLSQEYVFENVHVALRMLEKKEVTFEENRYVVNNF
jgi:hypothetical protein